VVKELRRGTPWADAVYRAAAVLYGAGATAVWLFGSRAREHARAADRLSDFDLAVAGLPVRSVAIARASREFPARADIVCVESAPAPLRSEILQDRILVPRVDGLAYGDSRPRTQLPDTLAGARIRAVAALIREVTPRSMIDFGCGQGWLLAELAADAGIERLTGVDFERHALHGAGRRISAAAGPALYARVALREGLLTHRDPTYLRHDAAAAVEVIEHLEAPQLEAFAAVLFAFVRPARAVLTTPNAEYNAVWVTRRERGRRCSDHRFEWSRAQFSDWAERIAIVHGYSVRIAPVGSMHRTLGSPTQLAVFDRRGCRAHHGAGL
jgi:predicted nucleotidyltransferase